MTSSHHTPLRRLLVLWIFLAAFFALRPLADFDLFTQMRIGSSLPLGVNPHHKEDLSYLLEGSLVASPGRLAQIIFAATAEMFGLRAIKLLNALLLSASIVLCLALGARAPAAKPVSAREPALLLSALLIMISIGPQSSARPQSFALLFFSVALIIVRGKADLLGAALLAALVWIWEGFHASAPIVLVLVAVETVFSPATKWPFAVAALGLLLPPYNLSAFELAQRNEFISRQVLGVNEWMPAWDISMSRAMAGPLVLLLAMAALLRKRRHLLNRREAVLALLFLGMTLYSARFSLFFSLYAATLFPRLMEGRRFVAPLERIPVGPVLPGVFLVFSLLLSPALSSEIPVEGVRTLESAVREGRIYNFREWAGPLHWFGSPNWKTGMDGRLYLFTPEQWREYRREAAGNVPVPELIRRYNPASFFLNPSHQLGLVNQLRADPGWRLLSEDESHVSFVRRAPAQGDCSP